MEHFDCIVVGAGHNGLVCATYLARSGRRVLVLEASDAVGGLAASREFHPGYLAAPAHSIGHFSEKVASDLELRKFGYDARPDTPPTVALDPSGNHISIGTNSIIGVSETDAAAYSDFRQSMQRYADTLAPFWLETMPRIGASGLSGAMTFARLGLRLRRLGRNDMREFLRVFSLPARDLVDERFEDERLKAALCWDGLIGSRLAPRSPNGAVLAMLYRMSGPTRGVPSIGITSLVKALRQAAESAGAEIRCGSPVRRFRVDGDKNGLSITGVQLADGKELRAGTVISSADPKRTFLDLLGVEHLDIGFTNRIHRLRSNGYVGKLHLALDGLPDFTGLDALGGRLLIAPSMDAIELAFDSAKYGGCPSEPVMEIAIPSLHDRSLAPDGGQVLSAHVMYVPYRNKGGWTAAARDEIRERSIDTIARYTPGIRERIVASQFLTPKDLERQYNAGGGHWHQTEFAVDQMLMMRPTYDAAQYRTPVPGLFLCGAGSHPGGDLTGMAGHNAAREILS